MLMGLDDAYITKGHVQDSMFWPCGLGCQLLGPCHYACSGKNIRHKYLLRVGSHTAQILFYAGWERV